MIFTARIIASLLHHIVFLTVVLFSRGTGAAYSIFLAVALWYDDSVVSTICFVFYVQERESDGQCNSPQHLDGVRAVQIRLVCAGITRTGDVPRPTSEDRATGYWNVQIIIYCFTQLLLL